MTEDAEQEERLLAAAARVREAIGAVLLAQWHPLDVGSDAEGAAAYEQCIGPLYQLLATGAGPLRIAAELAEAERRWGRRTPLRALLPVARALREVDVRLEGREREPPSR